MAVSCARNFLLFLAFIVFVIVGVADVVRVPAFRGPSVTSYSVTLTDTIVPSATANV